jgi:hypothetical protein
MSGASLAANGTSFQPTAAEFNAEIDRTGPRAVLSKVFENENLNSWVSKKIASGSADWLNIAIRLRPHSDASLTTLLNSAVAEALVRAPYRVLPLLESGVFTPSRSCLPFLSVEDPPEKNLLAITQLERALEPIRSKRFAAIKADCLVQAKQAREQIAGSR